MRKVERSRGCSHPPCFLFLYSSLLDLSVLGWMSLQATITHYPPPHPWSPPLSCPLLAYNFCFRSGLFLGGWWVFQGSGRSGPFRDELVVFVWGDFALHSLLSLQWPSGSVEAFKHLLLSLMGHMVPHTHRRIHSDLSPPRCCPKVPLSCWIWLGNICMWFQQLRNIPLKALKGDGTCKSVFWMILLNSFWMPLIFTEEPNAICTVHDYMVHSLHYDLYCTLGPTVCMVCVFDS